MQIGSLVQNYELDFQEPWFLGRKLILDTSIYRTVSDYQSLNNLYDVARTGFRVGLTRASAAIFSSAASATTSNRWTSSTSARTPRHAILDDAGYGAPEPL